MKFKMFQAAKAADVEKQVNDWLHVEKVVVTSSGCSMMQIPGPFVSVATFMITVFYEEVAS